MRNLFFVAVLGVVAVNAMTPSKDKTAGASITKQVEVRPVVLPEIKLVAAAPVVPDTREVEEPKTKGKGKLNAKPVEVMSIFEDGAEVTTGELKAKGKGRGNGNATSDVYFKNCSAARAAGYSNMRVGTPGYAPHLDRDNDGIACETR